MIRACAVATTAGVLVVSCALGCKKPGPPPPPPDPFAVPKDVGELRLASSTSTAAVEDGFPVYVGRDFLFADRPPKKLFEVPPVTSEPPGFAPAYKRSGPHDLFLVPLAEASPNGVERAVVYFDRETPYRVVLEVLFTIAQRSISRFELATIGKDGRTKMIESFAPRACRPTVAQMKQTDEDMQKILFALGSASASTAPPPPAPPAPATAIGAATQLAPCREGALGLTVLVVKDGLAVKARGGNIGPGCGDVGAGLTLPKSRSNTYDFDGLTTCVARLKQASPEFASEDEVTISASPNVPFESVVATMDATRSAPEGGVLFPKVKLGLSR